MVSFSHITVVPIGVIHTPFLEKYEAPRQPGTDKKQSEGIITLFPDHNYEQAVEDLEGFERIWIVSWFHKNTAWKPKVLPLRSMKKKGVFATRSPHRPNPIGLSLCKLISVDGRTIRVENPDLLDGTPILDIKPYIPYAEAFPGASVGWLDAVEDNTNHAYDVDVSETALRQAEWLNKHHHISLLDRATEVLSFDPTPHEYRRTDVHTEGGYVLAIKSWRIRYDIITNRVIIHSIESGYPVSVINAAAGTHTLHDSTAHQEFYKQWVSKNP